MTKTFPFVHRDVVYACRPEDVLPVVDHVPIDELYNSAVSISSPIPNPPVSSTFPLFSISAATICNCRV